MINQGLRQLQQALNRQADAVQREFVAVSDELKAIGRQLLEADEAERAPLLAEQEALVERQHALAEEVNQWRGRARAVLNQPDEQALRAYLGSLLQSGDEALQEAVQHTLYLLDAPEEELAKLVEASTTVRPLSAAGRLIERARTEFDLRSSNPASRKRAAVEFANRPGMAQNDEAVAEIDAAMEDPDPLVREVAILTGIQLHRFRALNLADLDAGHEAVKRLTRINHTAVIPVLIEILETPRTGYVAGENGPVETTNARSRGVALTRLVEWHTAEARIAVQKRRFDRDPQIVQVAERALEMFPGAWTGSEQDPASTPRR